MSRLASSERANPAFREGSNPQAVQLRKQIDRSVAGPRQATLRRVQCVGYGSHSDSLSASATRTGLSNKDIGAE